MNEIKKCKSRTPLRWPGGKSKVVKRLLAPMFPTEFNKFYEPFIGGASVALFISQMYSDKIIYVNDLNDKLTTLLKQIKNNHTDLIEKLHKTRNEYDPMDISKGRELLNKMQDQLYNEKSTDFEVAVAFYVLNKISFSGLTEHGSISKSAYEKTFNHTNIDRLIEISDNMQNFVIFNKHFKHFMYLPEEDDFTFLDPPYLIESDNLYGKKGELHLNFDHEEFLQSVKDLKGKWMITYNDCEWIREKYDFYNIENAEYRYCMSFQSDDEGNKTTRTKNELIITNY